VGHPILHRDRVTFGISALQGETAQHTLRQAHEARGNHPFLPPSPPRRTDLGFDGTSPAPSTAFVLFLLIAASAAPLLARPRLGGRVALASSALRPVMLVLELERPD
jgi:hypothetical protein